MTVASPGSIVRCKTVSRKWVVIDSMPIYDIVQVKRMMGQDAC